MSSKERISYKMTDIKKSPNWIPATIIVTIFIPSWQWYDLGSPYP